jgi:hypothetical protein
MEIYEEENEYHIIPEGSQKEHVGDENCWCHPHMETYDPETQVRVWVHHDLH